MWTLPVQDGWDPGLAWELWRWVQSAVHSTGCGKRPLTLASDKAAWWSCSSLKKCLPSPWGPPAWRVSSLQIRRLKGSQFFYSSMKRRSFIGSWFYKPRIVPKKKKKKCSTSYIPDLLPASECLPPEDMSAGFWGPGFWGWLKRTHPPKCHCTKISPRGQTSGLDAWSRGSLRERTRNEYLKINMLQQGTMFHQFGNSKKQSALTSNFTDQHVAPLVS